MTERELVVAMRDGDPWAWSEFHARFRPLLAAAARRVRLPELAGVTADEALVDEVLADEAARLAAPGAPEVPGVAGYLLRAARHKLFNLRRAAARRQRWYAEVAHPHATSGEVVVDGLCSAHVLRLAAGPADGGGPVSEVAESWPTSADQDASSGWDAPDMSRAVCALAAVIRDATNDEERRLLTWVGERVSHRMIASWLGVSYDAVTKRIWRLCRRVRGLAVSHLGTLGQQERADVERFLRRAGALPPLVATVAPAAARRELAPCPFGDDAERPDEAALPRRARRSKAPARDPSADPAPLAGAPAGDDPSESHYE